MPQSKFYRKRPKNKGRFPKVLGAEIPDKEKEVIGFFTDEEKRVRLIAKSVPRPEPSKGRISTPPSRVHQIGEARQFHERRSEKAQDIDEILEAQITANVEKWKKAPNRWDIRGVDFFPSPTIEGDFETNVKVLAYTTEQYYNTDTSKLRICGYKTRKAFDEAWGHEPAKGIYAFARGVEVHFSPRATDIVTKGKIETKSDFFAFSSVNHEIGHTVEGPQLAGRFGSALREGANEILAVRFTLNNMQMDRSLRKELRKEPYYSYGDEVDYTAGTALLLNDGDKEKAIEWIEEFHKADYDTKLDMYKKALAKLRQYEIRQPVDFLALKAHNYASGSWQGVMAKRRMVEDRLFEYLPKLYGEGAWWVNV